MALRVYILQHVAFEGPAAIGDWARQVGAIVSGTRPDLGELLPSVDAFDLLVIMGGPMSVNDEREHPWLVAEKRLVVAAVEAGRGVLGVCLGAQMIASAMGARVYRAPHKEIGWYAVERVSAEGLGAVFPDEFTPLHWHGETFDLPAGAKHLARTRQVANQAFQLGDRVVGLQFHLEATPESVRALVENAGHEIVPGPFQQTPGEIVAGASRVAALHGILKELLDRLARPDGRRSL